MTHQTFKICVVFEDSIENFYIKHFIDDFAACFEKFKGKIFIRNDRLKNNPNLKIYWIDDENDEINVSCEEDFRVYSDCGAHRKLYFSVKGETPENNVTSAGTSTATTSKKEGAKDEETTETEYDDIKKKKRMMKSLKLKMRQEREKRTKSDEEARKLRQQQVQEEINRKILEKQQKYLERHQRRCEKVRRMFQSVMDPANLSGMETDIPVVQENATKSESSNSNVPQQPTAPPSNPETPRKSNDISVGASATATATVPMYPSPDQIKQLTSAITNVLQPCNLIDEILGDVIGITSAAAAFVPMATQSQSQTHSPTQASQPQSDVSDNVPINNPSTPPTNSNTLLQNEDLIKKIAQSCGEIVSSHNVIDNILKDPNNPTQMAQESEAIMKNIAESTSKLIDTEAIVKEVLKNMSEIQASTSSGSSTSIHTQVEQVPVPGAPLIEVESENINLDKNFNENSNSLAEESILVVTPPTRSRESSVDVQDYNSIVGEDNDPWTFIDRSPKKDSEPKTGSKGFRIELSDDEDDDDDDSADDEDNIIMAAEAREAVDGPPCNPIAQKTLVEVATSTPSKETLSVSTETAEIKTLSAGTSTENREVQNASAQINLANVNASRSSQTPPPNQLTSGTQTPATGSVPHHPDPKINRAVDQMLQMGFSNEGNWLTQLLVNVDGNVSKALNFLTPNK